MKDISAHVMDITQNSITADASQILIDIVCDDIKDELTVSIADNGKGMSPEMLASVTSPFTTTRTTRKVGLGIPLFKEGCEKTGGRFSISSELGVGTTLTAIYKKSHIDRPPMGDMAGVLATLVLCNEDICFKIKASYQEREIAFDTAEVKNTLEGIPFSNPDVSMFIMGYLKEGFKEVFGGEFE